MKRVVISLLVVGSILLACHRVEVPMAVEQAMQEIQHTLDYNIDVKPILSDKCFACHGPDQAKVSGDLQLHLPELAYQRLPSGEYAIVPGKASKSALVHRILSTDPELKMPALESHLTLSDNEKAILIRWIEEGAVYKDHWAYLPIQRDALPQFIPNEVQWNEIDYWVQEQLKNVDLQPATLADKAIILRRLSLDLIGLPPTIEELENFLQDTSPLAYERQVDRLLASPHYGEQMAMHWMDLARYADTHGYSVDRYRDMSPWRDWVISAFNQNMPYDTFVTWQLAGDLMPNPSREMVIATGFNRLHPQNMEGGIVNEEFLIEYAADRASTFGQAFLGLTYACARCHDHKYDPISQKNFYELTSYFNNINESGQISWNNATPVPTLLLPTEEQTQLESFLAREIQKTTTTLDSIRRIVKQGPAMDWIEARKGEITLSLKQLKRKADYFSFDREDLSNDRRQDHWGQMKNETGAGKEKKFVPGRRQLGLQFSGDVWLDLNKVGVFGRTDEFSIGFWINIPNEITSGNIFHKGDGAILYNWRGYHLRVMGDHLEMMMAHTAPDNAIIERTIEPFPKGEWIHITMTYDGSSQASGLNLYINGMDQKTEVVNDHLYKEILFHRTPEPGLQFGARYRGKGIKDAIIDEIAVFDRLLSPLEVEILAGNEETMASWSQNSGKLKPEQVEKLKEHFAQVLTNDDDEVKAKLISLRKKQAEHVEAIQEMMVMKETETPVPAFLLERGDYTAKGPEVFPNTPEFIHGIPDTFSGDRLGLAEWLFHYDHPLTSRVVVNRIWQQFFGRGIVASSEDFGSQGQLPSHPELLDHLVNLLQSNHWDLKALQKYIVLSYTYRQSSLLSPSDDPKDRENKWLSRGPVKRLPGEVLRDLALKSSTLLHPKIGGPSVYPYQPEGLWAINGGRYNTSKGKDLYRRSLYTIWKRTVLHPTLGSFDAPSRDACVIQRQKTNTPLQALVLLNDPIFVESARWLGIGMLEEKGVEKGIAIGFRQLTSRSPTAKEIEILKNLYHSEYHKFKKDPQKMEGWLTTGASLVENVSDKPALCAMAVVASTILNSDAVIMNR